MANGKNDRKKFLEVAIAIIVLIIAHLLGIDVIPTDEPIENPEGKLIMTMIDVEQADCFLFEQGEYVTLIDCGTKETGDDVVKFLKNKGISRIDFLFGTHPHDDHMGAMSQIITNFEIGTIIYPNVKDGLQTSNWYEALEEQLESGKYNIEYSKVGSIYKLGEANIEIIGPITEPKNNLNNYSIVTKISFGEMDIIMTGDAEKAVEKELVKSGVNLEAEILKVGHHGSDTSSGSDFLDAVNPQYALISCGIGNIHEHPKEETMEELKERNIEVYRTDESGTVVVTITATDVSFNTEPDDYLSGVELVERKGK